MADAAEWQHHTRLQELCHESVDHRWLWALNRNHGITMTPEEFTVALKIRFGCDLFLEPRVCPLCAAQVLDRHGFHATCCAKGEATRGHNCVRDELLNCIQEADPAAELETSGLVAPRPNRRPADILTGCALPGTLASLDMCVASPHASGAGADCCAAAVSRKLAEYADDIPFLEQQGMTYAPMVWSCYGREHEACTRMLKAVARQAARRKGLLSHDELLSRFRQRLGVAIWRRAARMAMAVAAAAQEGAA